MISRVMLVTGFVYHVNVTHPTMLQHTQPHYDTNCIFHCDGCCISHRDHDHAIYRLGWGEEL